MEDVFFTADTHFDHENSLIKGWRKFPSVSVMNETMIENWNRVVPPKATVYHLGDFKMGKTPARNFLRRLNGKIILIRGNHDSRLNKPDVEAFYEVHEMLYLKNMNVFLCHYPMRSWPHSNYGSLQFYGHCHGTMQPFKQQIEVGVDCWNFTPISYEDAAGRIDKLSESC